MTSPTFDGTDDDVFVIVNNARSTVFNASLGSVSTVSPVAVLSTFPAVTSPATTVYVAVHVHVLPAANVVDVDVWPVWLTAPPPPELVHVVKSAVRSVIVAPVKLMFPVFVMVIV